MKRDKQDDETRIAKEIEGVDEGSLEVQEEILDYKTEIKMSILSEQDYIDMIRYLNYGIVLTDQEAVRLLEYERYN